MGNSVFKHWWILTVIFGLLTIHIVRVAAQVDLTEGNVHPPGAQGEIDSSEVIDSEGEIPVVDHNEPPGIAGPVEPLDSNENHEHSQQGTGSEPAVPLGAAEGGTEHLPLDTGLGPLGPGGAENFNQGNGGEHSGPQGPAVSENEHHRTGLEGDGGLFHHGEMVPAQPLHPEQPSPQGGEREVAPIDGGVIPGSQLEGQDLHNPHPQAGVEHPHETVIDHPNVEGTHPDPAGQQIPHFISVTDQPQIDVGETHGITPLKPTAQSVLAPTPPTNNSEIRNSSEVTSGGLTNSSVEGSHSGEGITPREIVSENFSEVIREVHTTLLTSSSSSVYMDEIVPTTTISGSSSAVQNETDVQIPNPDSNLLLFSRPLLLETETVTESVFDQSTHVLDSSEYFVVGSRTVPDLNVLETMSEDTSQVITSSYQDEYSAEGFIDASVSEISSTSVHYETVEILSSKDRKDHGKPPKTVTETLPEETPTSVVVQSRSVLSEQTMSVQDIMPSVTIENLEATIRSSDLPVTSSVTRETVTTRTVSSEAIVVTLPSGSQGIVVEKSSSPPVLSPEPESSSSSTEATTNAGSIESHPSSKMPTTKLSTGPDTTIFVSIFRNISQSTTVGSPGAPYTGDVTLIPGRTTLRAMLTTKRKNKPHHEGPTTPSNNMTSSENVTEVSTIANISGSDNRKKTIAPSLNMTTVQTLRQRSSSATTTLTPVTSSSTSHPTTSAPGTTLPHLVSTKPAVFAQIKLQMTWCEFQDYQDLFVDDLQDIFHVEGGHNVSTRQIMLMDTRFKECIDLMRVDNEKNIIINFYLVDVMGNYDEDLTIDCARVVTLGYGRKVESFFASKLLQVKLNTENIVTTLAPIESHPEEKGRDGLFTNEPGITIAIIIASVGGACCVALIILQVVVRQRNKRVYLPDSRHHSFTSMDSIAMASVTKSRPNSGLFNPGLDQADMAEPLYPVNFAGLANRCLEPDAIKEEFQLVPNYTPKLSTVPVGAEDKNRYANVIPVPQTRVKLKRRMSQANSDYINANFVTGFGDDKQAYIATQGPLEETIADFWRMAWEQQSRVIIMLTAIEENGHPKCVQYWPDCFGDSLQRYGDFMIHLKKKDVHQEYIITILELKDIENNLVREIKHCWYTCWPVNGTPEPISLVKFILDTRVFYEDSGAPLIVHCSPGTGRTGTFIATDICMRQYETRRIVDVLNTVYRMRQERAGAVQTKEQYMLIYNALNEYASVLSSPAISTASSSMTIHNLP